jgi:hypothetical protein
LPLRLSSSLDGPAIRTVEPTRALLLLSSWARPFDGQKAVPLAPPFLFLAKWSTSNANFACVIMKFLQQTIQSSASTTLKSYIYY